MITLHLAALPECKGCGGTVVPLTDESKSGQIVLKAWACINCGMNITLRSGELQEQEVAERKLQH